MGAEAAIPVELRAAIPRSNRHRWRNESGGKYQGAELSGLADEQLRLLRFTAERRHARRLFLAYARLFLFLRSAGWHRALDSAQRRQAVHVVRQARRVWSLGRVLRKLGLPGRTYRAWVASARTPCPASPLHKCRRRHSHQLLPAEVGRMRTWLTRATLAHWPVASLALLAARTGSILAGRSSWYRYRQALGLAGRRTPRKPKPRPGLRAQRPDAIWHLDVTPYRTGDGVRWYIHVLVDNYSRRRLAWAVHHRLRARHTVALLWRYWRKHGRNGGVQLMVDGGPENQGGLLDGLLARLAPHVWRVVAQRDIRFSNSMVEAAHKRLKYGFLHRDPPANGQELERRINAAFAEENSVRPLHVLGGRTPDEAYFGSQAPLPGKAERARAQQLL